MKSYNVTAVYDNGKTLIVKHTTKESAEQTVKIIKHNAQVENENVTITKEWLK